MNNFAKKKSMPQNTSTYHHSLELLRQGKEPWIGLDPDGEGSGRRNPGGRKHALSWNSFPNHRTTIPKPKQVIIRNLNVLGWPCLYRDEREREEKKKWEEMKAEGGGHLLFIWIWEWWGKRPQVPNGFQEEERVESALENVSLNTRFVVCTLLNIEESVIFAGRKIDRESDMWHAAD